VSKIVAAVEDMKTIQIKVDHINRIFPYFHDFVLTLYFRQNSIQYSRILKLFVKAIKPRTFYEQKVRF
jgi:hypothetical protein